MYIDNAARNRIKHVVTSKDEENLILITWNKTKFDELSRSIRAFVLDRVPPDCRFFGESL